MVDGSFERGWTGDYPALSLCRIFFLNPSIMIPATFQFFILVAMDSTFVKVSSQPKSLHEYSCHSVRWIFITNLSMISLFFDVSVQPWLGFFIGVYLRNISNVRNAFIGNLSMQNCFLSLADALIFRFVQKFLSVVEILDLKVVAWEFASNFCLFLCSESLE